MFVFQTFGQRTQDQKSIFGTHNVFSVNEKGQRIKINNQKELDNAQDNKGIKSIEYSNKKTGGTMILNPSCSFFAKEKNPSEKTAEPTSVKGLRQIDDINNMRVLNEGIHYIYKSGEMAQISFNYANNQLVFSQGVFGAPGGEGGKIDVGYFWLERPQDVPNELGHDAVQIQAKMSNSYVSILNFDGKPEISQYVWNQIKTVVETLGMDTYTWGLGGGIYWEKEGINNKMVDYFVIGYISTFFFKDPNGGYLQQKQENNFLLIPKDIARSNTTRNNEPLNCGMTSQFIKNDSLSEDAGILGGLHFVKVENGYQQIVTTANPFDIEMKTTGIRDIKPSIPTEFKLTNYPNPFNPATKISFNIPQNTYPGGAEVKIEVYNLAGQLVATLPKEGERKHFPGSHEIVFNAGDLVSGPYAYRLYFDDKQVAVGKAMLVK